MKSGARGLAELEVIAERARVEAAAAAKAAAHRTPSLPVKKAPSMKEAHRRTQSLPMVVKHSDSKRARGLFDEAEGKKVSEKSSRNPSNPLAPPEPIARRKSSTQKLQQPPPGGWWKGSVQHQQAKAAEKKAKELQAAADTAAVKKKLVKHTKLESMFEDPQYGKRSESTGTSSTGLFGIKRKKKR